MTHDLNSAAGVHEPVEPGTELSLEVQNKEGELKNRDLEGRS
jgi:hypothetical protein